jgi:hypothetical protein
LKQTSDLRKRRLHRHVASCARVQLRQPTNALVDATFLWRGKPVFGYRALQSEDGRSLIIISVDPVSRVALTTVVVYDRRQLERSFGC